MKTTPAFLKNYSFSLILLGSILLGSVIGYVFQERARVLKPLGDIFLNLLFTIVVPMVFFSISSAIAGMSDTKRLGRIILWMLLIFVLTGVISSSLMVIGVKIYNPTEGISLNLGADVNPEQPNIPEQIVKTFTVPDFKELLSKKNMLALIVFSVIVGLSAARCGEKARPFVQFLLAGNAVMGKAVSYIMLYAPVGLGAYFAYLVGVFGPELLGSYMRAMKLYYPLAFLYFFIGFSFYAYLAAGRTGVRRFWSNIVPASLTALATGSSIATIPANLQAADRIGTPKDISEVVIPIGATIHMDGSCLAAILKISILFGLCGADFSGVQTVSTAIGLAILCGVVISGVPAGGMLGELLIVTFYGFPIEALPIISMVGTLVDPPATMVNAVGDNVASMMVARILGGKKWLEQF